MKNKPFGNISKLKKQKPSTQLDPPKQQKSYEQQNIMQQRPPTGKLKLGGGDKPKVNIYDAVRKLDEQKQQPGGTTVHKPSLSFKKNRLGLGQKKQGPLGSDNNRQARQQNQQQQQQAVQNQSNIPRPTPVFNRNKGKLLMGKSKQKPVISQQAEKQDLYSNLINNNNRMAYVNEEEQAGNDNQDKDLKQQNSKKLIKPNLFKGVGGNKPVGGKLLNSSPATKQQKLLNNSVVYQQYEHGSTKKQKFNFQQMMNVQAAEINFQPKVQQVPLYKIQKQNKRAKQLSNLLNLEIDLYEQMTSISSTTPFEVYISKIKAGFLKNSCDEAFDQKNEVMCQTSSYQYVDFSNQCPQDYQLIHGYQSNESESVDNFQQFVLRVAPLIQELIKPSKHLVMPPTSLLAFSPVFKTFLKCPSPTFIYFSQKYNYSLVAIGEKLYICEDQIECALDMGGTKIAGLKNGRIVLWNGQNDRASTTYSIVREIIQSQNFQLPAHVTNDFDRLSPYLCQGSIVALLPGDEQNTFYSFDSTAKLIKWSIQKISRSKTSLVPKQVYQFSKILEKRHLVGFGLKKRNQIFYLWTSSGIVCWNGQSVSQKLETSGIKQFYLPKRSNLVFCLTEFNTIQIFSIQYHECLDEIRVNSVKEDIQQVIIPELQHQNREISIFYQIYIVAQDGGIYQLKFTQKQVDSKKIADGIREGQQGGGKSKRSSNIIYQGINIIGKKIEKIKLFKDLKCTTQIQDLGVDLSPNVNNLKSILTKNKQFISNLMEKNLVLV